MLMPASKSDQKAARWLLIPMEIVERELNGNLLLCLEAVKNGWSCILGTKRSIMNAAEHLPVGAVFLKSVTAPDLANIRKLKSYGNTVTSLDVEGLVYTCVEEFVTVRFSKETVQETDMLFFWGDLQRKGVADAYPVADSKCHTTGSPIADLWQRPELHEFFKDDATALQARFGRYILIPSSFGTVNHFIGREANKDIIMRDKMIAPEKEQAFFAFWDAYEDHVFGVFQKFLKILPAVSAAFPDHKIIVRPHPAESHETWLEAAKDLPNVSVLFEGVVAPWLLGAEAILHWGCTTALEGYLMGRPVVSYNPVTPEAEEKFDHRLPHSISIITRTPDEAVAALRNVIEQPGKLDMLYPSVKAGEKVLREWVYDTGTRTASENIMILLKTLDLASRSLGTIPEQKMPLKEKMWSALDRIIPDSAYPALPRRIRLGLESRAYGRHKTRDIDETTLHASLAKLARIQNAPPVAARALAKNLYVIEKI